jgi:glycosyltransferase involved in cell wall biosynthesis
VADDTFLAVGAAILFPHRRFEDMIEAIALLADEPRIEALIIGSDHGDRAYSDRLSALIEERGVGERVSLPRRSVSEAELRDAYAAADVFVFPNQRQTWGLAPLEALAAGTPAIVSSGAGVHEILLDRPGVRIVPPEQPAAIADALRAASAADDRAAAGPTRDWLRSELTNDRYAEKMAGLYERAIANARKTVR